MRAICISSPHRHSGPSVQSRASNRSIEDMKTTHDNWDYPAMHALEVQHKLNFKHGTGFRIKIKKRGGQSPSQKEKVPAPQRSGLQGVFATER